MKRLVAVVGPTAVGKSALAFSLAQKFSGEIVNADSRQVYRLMDIGSAKPEPERRTAVPHHLLDVVNPDEEFSLAHFQRAALEHIQDIQNRGKLPLLVGGSGMYVWSVLEGWQLPKVPPDPQLRSHLAKRASTEGPLALYRELEVANPEAARSIDPRNLRRVIRALEICHRVGPSLQTKKPLTFPVLVLGLTVARTELYRRGDERVEQMMSRGLLEEVQRLWQKGYTAELPSMSGIGYWEIGLFLKGQISLEEAVLKTKHATHRLCRHQYAWFRLRDPRIHWFDVSKDVEQPVFALVGSFLEETQ